MRSPSDLRATRFPPYADPTASTSAGPQTTPLPAGLMLFIFIVLVALAAHGYAYTDIRPIDGHSFWRRLTWQNNPA